MAEREGFELVFLSGYCLTASLTGEPDFGLITQTQVLDAATRICAAITIPIIVDIDTGFGGPFNVERTVSGLIQAGASGCFLEDQQFPKRCGHLEHKQVVPVEEYLPKLRAALRVRHETPFHVTARTDALTVLGIDEAIRRAKIYRDEGADAVFIEAPRSIHDLAKVRAEVADVTLVANMVEQGKTPILPAQELYDMGYTLIAVPVAGLLATSNAMAHMLRNLREQGSTLATQKDMLTFQELNGILGLNEKYEREKDWLE
jgi:methylisocitrate lyase